MAIKKLDSATRQSPSTESVMCPLPRYCWWRWWSRDITGKIIPLCHLLNINVIRIVLYDTNLFGRPLSVPPSSTPSPSLFLQPFASKSQDEDDKDGIIAGASFTSWNKTFTSSWSLSCSEAALLSVLPNIVHAVVTRQIPQDNSRPAANSFFFY